MVFRSFEAYWDQENQIRIQLGKIHDREVRFSLEDQDHYPLDLVLIREEETEDKITFYYEVQGLDFDSDYTVYDQDRNHCLLQYGRIVQTEFFDQTFDYLEDDLGANYQPEATVFKVWAPISKAMLLKLEKGGQTFSYALEKRDQGVWQTKITGNWEGASYTYLHQVNGQWIETHDPYALSSSSNSGASYVIDLDQVIQPIKRAKNQVPMTQSVIYELSVRDFSWQKEAGFKQAGKFLGLLESPKLGKEQIGLSYLKNLGITHLQIMPLYDFGSVDENFPELAYNWGYDPVQYNVPEGSFSSNPDDPYVRIKEVQTMVAGLHAADLSVIMDVVYNHVYQADDFALEKLVPGYAFRWTAEGFRTNGSFCGNDLATQRPMIRRYIVRSLKVWCALYGFDGFRFDLMGLIDQETLRIAQRELEELYPNVYLYGEGWKMETGLDSDLLGHQYLADRLPAFGFFSDDFRNAIKAVALDPDLSKQADFQAVINRVLTGSTGVYGPDHFVSPHQAINYTECHDNATVYDYLAREDKEISPQRRKRAAKLALALPLLAQGVPFIHSGQELYRTKFGLENSYASPDAYNSFDWTALEQEEENLAFFKELLAFRKTHPILALDSKIAIQKAVQIEWQENGLVTYQLSNREDQLRILINFSGQDQAVSLDGALLLASESLIQDQDQTYLPSQSFVILGQN